MRVCGERYGPNDKRGWDRGVWKFSHGLGEEAVHRFTVCMNTACFHKNKHVVCMHTVKRWRA